MTRTDRRTGRRYRVVSLEAADTRAASRHISAQRPEPLDAEAKTRLAQLGARR